MECSGTDETDETLSRNDQSYAELRREVERLRAENTRLRGLVGAPGPDRGPRVPSPPVAVAAADDRGSGVCAAAPGLIPVDVAADAARAPVIPRPDGRRRMLGVSRGSARQRG